MLAELYKSSITHGGKALAGENGKGLAVLRYLESLLPSLPGKTSVLQGRIESHHSPKDMSRSRWDFRAKLPQSRACRNRIPGHGNPVRPLSGSLAPLPTAVILSPSPAP